MVKQYMTVMAFVGLWLAASPAWAEESARPQGEFFEISVTLREAFGSKVPEYFAANVDRNHTTTWDVRLPAGYDRARPAGIMVYISPMPVGRAPQRWRKTLDEQNLIWIGARNGGNTVMNGRRKSFALMGLILASREFSIDPSRTYLSGFSGGGRVASIVMVEFPSAFNGAIFFCGVNFIDDAQELYDAVKSDRFVFLSGAHDFNLPGIRQAYSKYRQAGVVNSKLLVVPNMEHELPSGKYFADALDYLDDK